MLDEGSYKGNFSFKGYFIEHTYFISLGFKFLYVELAI